MQISNHLTLLFYRKLKISNANCLNEMTILVDTILYLSLYYLVNDLVHLPDLPITCHGLKLCLGLLFEIRDILSLGWGTGRIWL